MLLSATMALTTVDAMAANVEAAAAQEIAINFVRQRTTKALQPQSVTPMLRLTHTEASAKSSEANAFYVFNIGDNDGFVIIAGDDRARQVLGYSNQGNLDWNHMPDNLRAWLGQYRKQIEYLQEHPDLQDAATPAASNSATPVVGPLCSTTWGQEAPYYNRCPKLGNEYCVTGCVATAMAQVMYYWKYPSSVTPSFSSYSTGSLSVPGLSSTTFKWTEMLDSYCHWDYTTSALVQDSYTDTQADAVAELMRYCGQSVHMNYSPNGSGAYTWNQESAMEEFGFDILTGLKSAYSYSASQWVAMLNADLDAGRPILYSASDENDDGGHAFIIDGYDSNGNYHLNWGWYGTGDGYYPINALNVEHRDGTKLYYNVSQQAILGVEPPADAITTHAAVVAAAENVTATSFTARWSDDTPAENVKSYTLYVNAKGAKPKAELLEEVDWSSSSTVPNGWSKSAFNYSSGSAYFSSSMGYVQSKSYNLEAYDKITVMVYAEGSRNNSSLTLSTSLDTETKTSLSRNAFQWYTFTLDCATSDYVKMTASTTTQIRGIKIYAGEPEEGKLLVSSENGDATQRVIAGITDTTYTVTGLSEGGTYTYYVVALYKTNKTQRSNTMEVTLSSLKGDLNGDGVIDVRDVNILIMYILNHDSTQSDETTYDINNNGTVDVSDVNTLIGIIVGI